MENNMDVIYCDDCELEAAYTMIDGTHLCQHCHGGNREEETRDQTNPTRPL